MSHKFKDFPFSVLVYSDSKGDPNLMLSYDEWNERKQWAKSQGIDTYYLSGKFHFITAEHAFLFSLRFGYGA